MIMVSLALIGLVGGLITGISPCILPVLPVIFFSGTTGTSEGTVAVEAKRDVSRPYRVIAGLVLSFSLVTLVGSALLSLLHLPQDAIRWVALVALVAIGLGLIFPRFEELLERPFARIPQKQIATRTTVLVSVWRWVCCTFRARARYWRRSWWPGRPRRSVCLSSCSLWRSPRAPRCRCCSSRWPASESPSGSALFVVGSAQIRVTAGMVTILLAVALVFNLPAALQRAIPDYTGSLQNKLGGDQQVQQPARWYRQRPEQRIIELRQRHPSNCRIAARRPTSRASPRG